MSLWQDGLRWAVNSHSGLTGEAVIAAPAAGKRIVVYYAFASGSNANTIILQDGDGGADIGPRIHFIGAGAQSWFGRYKCTAATALFTDQAAGSGTFDTAIGYKIEDV